MICFYKKTFLKDLTKLPLSDRKKVERIVFEDVPKFDNIFQALDVKKMRGHKNYYRIRTGDYRIRCRIEGNKVDKESNLFYNVRILNK